jgi:hypothetical protein
VGYRFGGEASTIDYVEFRMDATEVGLDRPSRHEQSLCDFAVGQSLGHRIDDGELGGGEAAPSVGGASSGSTRPWGAPRRAAARFAGAARYRLTSSLPLSMLVVPLYGAYSRLLRWSFNAQNATRSYI